MPTMIGRDEKTGLRAALRPLISSALIAAFALLMLFAAGPSTAAAKEIQIGFAEEQFQSEKQKKRELWLDRAQQAGSGWARVGVGWRGIAPNEPADPTDVNSPSYFWGGPDRAVRSAAAFGQEVVMTVATAPEWAEGPGRPSLNEAPAGTWKPDVAAYANFLRVVATRYSGSFPDPLNPGQTLPRVRHFEIWNEPNLTAFLAPQYEGKKAVSPAYYRAMVNAASAAIKSVQPNGQIIAGALSPFGEKPGGKRVRPQEFFRTLFCLNKKLKPLNCGGEQTALDVMSHHPIGPKQAPDEPANHKDDATIAEMGKLKKILKAAEKNNRISTPGSHPLWATEIWWQSNPPYKREKGVPNLKDQAAYYAQGIYELWRQGVPLVLIYQVVDQKKGRFQTGLYFANKKPKPSAQAVRFPVVGDRKSKKKVLVWGRAPVNGKAKIEVKQSGGWKTVHKTKVKAGKVFTTKEKIKGKAKIRAKVGREKSFVWSQSKK